MSEATPDEGRHGSASFQAFFGQAQGLVSNVASLAGLPDGALAFFLARGLPERKAAWVVVPTPDQAELLAEGLRFWGHERRVLLWPLEDRPPYSGLSPPSLEVADRIVALDALLAGEPVTIVAPAAGLAARVVAPEVLIAASFDLKRGKVVPRRDLLLRLSGAGYLSTAAVEDPGTFAVRGGIVEIWPAGDDVPVRLDLLDDEIERIQRFDPETRRGRDRLERLRVRPAREWFFQNEVQERFLAVTREAVGADVEAALLRRRALETLKAGLSFAGVEDWLPALHPVVSPLDYEPAATLVAVDPEACLDAARRIFETAVRRHREMLVDERPLVAPSERFCDDRVLADHFKRAVRVLPLVLDGTADLGATDNGRWKAGKADLTPVARKLRDALDEGWRVALIASGRSEAERTQALFHPHGLAFREVERLVPERLRPSEAVLVLGELHTGFTAERERLAIVPAREIFVEGKAESRAYARKVPHRTELGLDRMRENDWVVHSLHGIGQFLGMARLDVAGVATDFLRLAYRGGDILYLPVHKLDLLSRYKPASEGVTPHADRLGGATWAARKARVKDAMLRTASDLLLVHARRELSRVEPLPRAGSMVTLFEAQFPFDETPDQTTAIADVYDDLEKDRPMDRLVIGDVGFGKTEVAMRAAARMVEAGRQVAVLCPTTILAYQHQVTWSERFEGFPVRIAMLSRFTDAPEHHRIQKALKDGSLDILIGTTRLLGRGVSFKNLGLIVVDEEHRFGVRQKEHLKKLRAQVHLLSLSATPIPRTLSLALSGLRSFSTIATPPEERLSVTTRIAHFEAEIIRDEILREMGRGGQIFFVHNRVRSIPAIEKFLKKLVPEARIQVAHGQMADADLEAALVSFIRRHADILLCSAIIESGVDLPNVNCMIVNRADRFGLAQLYQIRGRVGRSWRRGRCTLLVPPEGTLPKDAIRRLRALQEHQELGAGFNIANADLEIRGAGEIIGEHQHGHLDAVGLDTYLELLAEAVAEARGDLRRRQLDPEVEVPVPAFIPETLIPGVEDRLAEYRRLSRADRPAEVRRWVDELEERFGALPEEVIQLGWLVETRLRCRTLGIARISWLKIRVELHLSPDHVVPATRLAARARLLASRLEGMTPDGFSVRFTDEEARHPFRFLHWLLKLLEED